MTSSAVETITSSLTNDQVFLGSGSYTTDRIPPWSHPRLNPKESGRSPQGKTLYVLRSPPPYHPLSSFPGNGKYPSIPWGYIASTVRRTLQKAMRSGRFSPCWSTQCRHLLHWNKQCEDAKTCISLSRCRRKPVVSTALFFFFFLFFSLLVFCCLYSPQLSASSVIWDAPHRQTICDHSIHPISVLSKAYARSFCESPGFPSRLALMHS